MSSTLEREAPSMPSENVFIMAWSTERADLRRETVAIRTARFSIENPARGLLHPVVKNINSMSGYYRFRARLRGRSEGTRSLLGR